MSTFRASYWRTRLGLPAADDRNAFADELPQLVTQRPQPNEEPPAFTLRPSTPSLGLPTPPRPSCGPEDVIGDRCLSGGARRLYGHLFRLACDVARTRGYQVMPNAVVFHVPALMVAALVGYTDRHTRRLVHELEAAQLLDAGAHASKVGERHLWSGVLWSVKVTPGDPAPRLRPDEFRHQFRHFEDDLKAGRTAQKVMSELLANHATQEEIYRAVYRAAVDPTTGYSPVELSADIAGEERLEGVRDVAFALLGLLALHPAHRVRAITRMADTLARTLKDLHSRRFYAGAIWGAVSDAVSGGGGLQALSAALLRLSVDVAEWPDLRSPGALLAHRLRAA